MRLQQISCEHGLDLEALCARTGCGTKCTLCRPYVDAMLRTGRTSFDPGDPEVAPTPTARNATAMHAGQRQVERRES